MARIPDKEHWAIITTSSYTVPGDERSRTHPGHGYPEHSVETIEYDAYSDFHQFERAVESATHRKSVFRAVHVMPMTVEVSVSVKVK